MMNGYLTTEIDEERPETDPYRKAFPKILVCPGVTTGAYFYCCAACGKTFYETFQYHGFAMNPGPFDKWWAVERPHGDWTYYCSDHEIKEILFVDGKESKK